MIQTTTLASFWAVGISRFSSFCRSLFRPESVDKASAAGVACHTLVCLRLRGNRCSQMYSMMSDESQPLLSSRTFFDPSVCLPRFWHNLWPLGCTHPVLHPVRHRVVSTGLLYGVYSYLPLPSRQCLSRCPAIVVLFLLHTTPLLLLSRRGVRVIREPRRRILCIGGPGPLGIPMYCEKQRTFTQFLRLKGKYVFFQRNKKK